MYIWRKQVTPDWLRPRSEELTARFGPTIATVKQPGKRRILLEVSCPTLNQGRRLVREFGGHLEKLPQTWRQDFAKRAQTKPLRIGSRLRVLDAPAKKHRDKAVRTIIIPAEAAFGTGEHATTAMCLRMLERQTRSRPSDWSMLDAGTGSGILAIAARCFGAGRVLAIDNDPLACAIAERNARRNGLRNIDFRSGDVLKLKLNERFDVITANLYSEILIKALPRWCRQLAPNGFLILSGILRSQERILTTALRRNRFAVKEVRRRGKWIALRAVPRRKKS